MRHLLLNLFCLFCLSAIFVGTLRENDTQQLQQLSGEESERRAQDKSGRLLLDGLRMHSPEVAKELA